ncbi:hypothetical protein HRI_002635900 [Hibiscus trionum]|uniref:Reverse transcriptase n=1 Tax=Hibiscus trionum TaxID=183268 RepID=A0A9W7I6Y0_HIBTR|nr:hypothetical protein HRI_002635900 [Hibiscus trionum]
MNSFRNVLEDCSLSDIGYKGRWYTWQKGVNSAAHVRERLDRGVVNGEWWEMISNFSLSHLSHTFSNHCPLLLDTNFQANQPKNHMFRFEAAWLMEESCMTEVKRLWESSIGSVPDRLQAVGSGLDRWFSELRRRKNFSITSLEKKLHDLLEMDPSDDVLGDIMESKLLLNMEYDKVELYWEQRARSNWMKNGDRNTTFFHRSATSRKRKNRITSLLDDTETRRDSDHEMAEVARGYFHNLFSSQGIKDPGKILQGIVSCTTSEMNQVLCAEFEPSEVYQALKTMNPLKAAGNDGFGALFYQKLWDLVGSNVSDYCIGLLNGSFPMESVDCINVVLVSKTNNPSSMLHDRPISLCNVLYKLASKVLVLRFQNVLHFCIDEAQSAFVPGRLITDNNIVAYEMLHSFKKKRVGATDHFALKLDMSKRAYLTSSDNPYRLVIYLGLELIGQLINFDKSWIFFSSNVASYVMEDLKDVFGVNSCTNLERYLGLPAIVGRNKRKAFTNLRDKMNSHTMSWSIRPLSQGDGEYYRKILVAKIRNEERDSLVYLGPTLFLEGGWGPWLSGPCKGNTLKKVTSPVNLGVSRVANLFSNGLKEWNLELLHSLFQPVEVRDISSILLSSFYQEDVLVWTGEHSRVYTVRSGYRLLISHPDFAPTVKSFYRHLWSLKCPEKFKFKNKRLHENALQRKEEIITFIKAYCSEYSTLSTRTQSSLSNHVSSWKPPSEGFVKTNFDACFNSGLSESFSGIVIRNNCGEVMGIRRISSKIVYSSLCPRSCNRVSHSIAKLGAESSSDNYWVEEVPLEAMALVAWDGRFQNPP